jgi:hypothetical protein
VEISIAAGPLYQHLLPAEKQFCRCVSFGEPPRLFGSNRHGRGSRRSGPSTWVIEFLGRFRDGVPLNPVEGQYHRVSELVFRRALLERPLSRSASAIRPVPSARCQRTYFG